MDIFKITSTLLTTIGVITGLAAFYRSASARRAADMGLENQLHKTAKPFFEGRPVTEDEIKEFETAISAVCNKRIDHRMALVAWSSRHWYQNLMLLKRRYMHLTFDAETRTLKHKEERIDKLLTLSTIPTLRLGAVVSLIALGLFWVVSLLEIPSNFPPDVKIAISISYIIPLISLLFSTFQWLRLLDIEILTKLGPSDYKTTAEVSLDS